MSPEQTEQIKHAGDALAVGTTVGAVIGWLPAIAALATIIWTLIRIYETKTMRRFVEWFNKKLMG